LATVAAVIGTAGNLYCETVSFPQKVGGGTLYAGVFNYRTRDYVAVNDDIWVYTTCNSYNTLDKELGFDYFIDSKTKTTMAFAIMAPVIGGICLVFAYIAPCFTTSPARWKTLGTIFLLVSILQGITLIILESSICLSNPVLQYLETESPNVRETFPDECERTIGFNLGISAVVFWFLAGVSMYVLPAPVLELRQPPQTQEVTYQQNADGTVEETNVVVVKGAAVPDEQAETAVDESK
jgi:hypothetical protein